jgi:hypothetical protein
MTQDEIIEMARESGLETQDGFSESVFYFAKLAAEKEREACAKVCEDGINNATDWDSSVWDQACENRAFAIRARGKA